MRIISGKYKHRRIDVPANFKARPTTDFAKESLFNILENSYDFEGDGIRVLDLFAGTGSISLEFLSRGCQQVVSVEKDFRHYQFLAKTAAQTADPAWTVLKADARKYLQRATAFDIVFADPPYDLDWLAQIPQLVLPSPALAPGALFILEHGRTNDFADNPLFQEKRTYGAVNFSFFRKA